MTVGEGSGACPQPAKASSATATLLIARFIGSILAVIEFAARLDQARANMSASSFRSFVFASATISRMRALMPVR